MTREEQLTAVVTFFLMMSPFLPWYTTTGSIPEIGLVSIRGIFSSLGIVVLIFSIILLLAVLVRRPFLIGLDNLTLALAIDVVIMVPAVIMAISDAFYEVSFGSVMITGAPGWGLYLALVCTLLLAIMHYRLRTSRGSRAVSEEDDVVEGSGEDGVSGPPSSSLGEVVSRTGRVARSGVERLKGSVEAPDKDETSVETDTETVRDEVAGPSVRTAPGSVKDASKTGASDDGRSVRDRRKRDGSVRKTSPGPERERLVSWLKRVNRDRQVFEKCPSCEDYVFLDVEKEGDTVTFACTGCSSDFKLRL